MGTSTIFYLLSVLLSLYCAWLVAFRTYKMEYSLKTGKIEPTDERFVYPRLVYILITALCFAPIANVVLCVVFFVFSLVGQNVGDFYVKSWLFEKPEETKKEKDSAKRMRS